MSTVVRDPDRLFAKPSIELLRRPDGSMLLRSCEPLRPYARCIGEYLEWWARKTPGTPFLLERSPADSWRCVTYAQACARVRRIAAGLLGRDLGAQRPIVILAENSIDHALVMLAAMHVGIPSVSVSAAYSLVSSDFSKLKSIVALVDPGAIFVASYSRFERALQAIADINRGFIITGEATAPTHWLTSLAALEGEDRAAVERAFSAIGPDTVAKLLFTSGSTSEPKGVINTHRMLCSNQEARAQVWPFLAQTPPVLVDWLPWSHTFGGNFNLNMVLRHGGTLYIDGGRPTPTQFEQTVVNLREVAPTVYCNVARGYDMLVSALQSDAQLRRNFFSKLQVIFYAAAALPQNLWDALNALSLETVGEAVPLVSAWGSTETAPLATDCHFQAERAGVIGVPIPGCDLKLVRSGPKLEARVRGVNVTPGYWRRAQLTASHFDDEGYYLIGDAVRFVDAQRPERGLYFDGRVAEDFKLDSGTWVNVGMLRLRAIAALAPVAQDVVLTGHERSEIGLLIFPSLVGCRQLCSDLAADAAAERVLCHSAVRARVATALASLRADGQGSSTYATRALLLTEPPSIDAGEITDKGYINQRAVLSRRAALVERLYSESIDVICLAAGDSAMAVLIEVNDR